ncbi:glycosyltransferase family 2 protein [Nocardioides abyssi]|uniref:Glycosyltransferase family 2 protein n=1 Tax=Nocardioides abyssi TaxID=3058370 RepID=A0ABT8ESI8_9ACTN|nr:glycosyltransferase family 2 protein [Nocardioides abyssi]MDN4161122.1 glycosyltransferase family 2 protein [Nocardioides abyssi]
MLCTVSTVRDSLPNVERFVQGNLANGVDHMFIVLDAPDDQVETFLNDHPHVTCLRGDETWWAGRRPPGLNVRQRLNANFVKALLSAFSWAEWIFHIDSDEVVQVDRSVLATTPAGVLSARLAPMEAVSQRQWLDDPTWFKPLLPRNDLALLTTLGVLEEPSNMAFFRGHTRGKAGVRPRLDVWVGIHSGLDAQRQPLPAFTDETLNVLHYESFSGEEFVRKWKASASAQSPVKFRSARAGTALAVQALLSKGLSDEMVASYLMRVYERTSLDDFATLRGLGLLVEVDPSNGSHRPVPFPPGAHADMMALLDRLAVEPKNAFGPRSPVDAAQRALERAVHSV